MKICLVVMGFGHKINGREELFRAYLLLEGLLTIHYKKQL